MLKFELVLPAYNEGLTLKHLISRAVKAAKENNFSSEEFNLVVVENGSKDESLKVLEDLKNGDLGEWFRIVRVNENKGYGNGIWHGLSSTSAKFVGWSHADMQCDPLDAFKALKLVDSSEELTLAKGIRFKRNWKDRVVSRVFELVALVLLGIRVYEINAQPKVFRRDLLKSVRNPPLTFAFDIYILYQAIKNNYKIRTIPVDFPPRIHGVSNWASTFFGRYKTILGMIKYMRCLSKSDGRL